MQNYGTVPQSSSYAGGSASVNVGFFSRARGEVGEVYAHRRPWSELLQITSFNKPDSFADAAGRIRKNLFYFRVNYALIIFGIVFLGLLWHPVSLIVLIVMFVLWGFLYFFREEPLVVFRKTLSEKLVIGSLTVLTLVALLLTHATTAFLVALAVAVVLVLLHAALREPEYRYFNDEEGGGMISVVDTD